MDGKYTTREGQPVRILAVDRARSNTPVVFLLTHRDGREYVDCCDLNGKWDPDKAGNSNRDLIPAKQYRYKTLAELCKEYPDLKLEEDGSLMLHSGQVIAYSAEAKLLGQPYTNETEYDKQLLVEIKPITCNECTF